MARVVFLRLAAALPLLLAVTLLSFLLLHWAPGSFLDRLRFQPGVSPELIHRLELRYGLDKAWYFQYASWLAGIASGDLGFSIGFQRPVATLLWEALPYTLSLAALAQVISFGLGLSVGLLAFARPQGLLDRFFSGAALTLSSLHPIVLALGAMSLSAATGLLPVGGGSSPVQSGSEGLDFLRHLILPCLALSLAIFPGFFLQARGGFADVAPAPFVQAARARGLPWGTVVRGHVLPAALVPLLSYAGSSIGRLLSVAFLIEVITGWPGMGRLALSAIRDRDSFLLLGALILAASMLFVGNLMADLLVARADPRVRLEAEQG